MQATYKKIAPEKLARMVEISRVLNSTTNLDELLTVIIKEAASLTRSEAASILLLDPRTRQLYFKAASNGIPPELASTPVPLDSSIAGAVLRENRPMIIEDVSQDKRWNPNVDQTIQFHTSSILGVPMHNAQQKAIGVLEAINKLNGRFSDEDIETITVLADLAGVAVEKARLIQALEKAYAELNELDQLKTDFIAVASHELRTPLSVILGYVSFLREEATPEMAEQLDGVLEAAVHLRNLIQEMLNLRYVDAGEATLDLEVVDFVQFIREMQLESDESLRTKQHQISVKLPDMQLPVLIDRSMIEVVIGNLLNNAIKFTPAGGRIDLGVQPKGGEAWFWIRDTGVGIPPDKLERIFKRFYQVESPLRRRHEGMGLGLSIARELVSLHKGRIWAQSQPNKGSIFVVALPLHKGEK
ncbi:MAG: sensor histidine kinase [Chloroflexi bacterium]|nr:MAG: sensor histidine kinase [Chloroflexota bacterium]